MNEQVDILLVEDDQDDRVLALNALQREGLASQVFAARDGEEALDFLFCRGTFTERSFDHPPKLILLDLKLPNIDGMEVLRSIRQNELTSLIPVVILTSSAEQRDVIEGYKLGANSFIQKPVDFGQFAEAVKVLGLYWLLWNKPPPLGK